MYLTAFYDLSTCRPYLMGGPGPIPWTAVRSYSEFLGLDRDLLRFFSSVVRVVDAAWLEWMGEEMKARAKR